MPVKGGGIHTIVKLQQKYVAVVKPQIPRQLISAVFLYVKITKTIAIRKDDHLNES